MSTVIRIFFVEVSSLVFDLAAVSVCNADNLSFVVCKKEVYINFNVIKGADDHALIFLLDFTPPAVGNY